MAKFRVRYDIYVDIDNPSEDEDLVRAEAIRLAENTMETVTYRPEVLAVAEGK